MFYVHVRPWFYSDTHVQAPSFWTLRILGNLIQLPSGNLLKEQGSSNLLIEHGAQRSCPKAQVHRARKGSNPNTIHPFIGWARSTDHSAPHYAASSTPLLPHPSQAQVFSSAPCSQTPSARVPPSVSATKFHTRCCHRAKFSREGNRDLYTLSAYIYI